MVKLNPPKDETVNKKIASSVQLGRQMFCTGFKTNAQDLNPTTPDASYPWGFKELYIVKYPGNFRVSDSIILGVFANHAFVLHKHYFQPRWWNCRLVTDIQNGLPFWALRFMASFRSTRIWSIENATATT